MGQDPEAFPKCDIPAGHQEEQIIRDFYMFNYHINSHKMRWLKDVVDIIDAHRYMFDFCEGLDDGILWNIDSVGQGETYTCTDEVNGVLLMQNGAAEDDNIEITRLCECWKLVDCYPLYCELRFKIDDPVLGEFWFGLITGTSFFTPPNDFVVFEVDGAADANLEISNSLNGAGNETLTGHVLTADTWLRLGIHWDGDGIIRWFVIQDGDAPQTILYTGQITTHIVQDEELTVGFGIQNGSAVARNMKVDYLKICQKRVIE
jgi:hypothetical protein